MLADRPYIERDFRKRDEEKLVYASGSSPARPLEQRYVSRLSLVRCMGERR